MVKYRITIDRNLCIACGIAPSICPQVFALGDDNGKNRVIDTYNEKTTEEESIGVVSEELYDCAKQGTDACPVQAISLKKID